MALSSNSIIHFTKTKESLIGILRENFKIYYCLEELKLNGNEYALGVPMVSFCDIPLSEVKDHISKYGAYGIGLTKKWAEKNKLNPVLYMEDESLLSKSYTTIFHEYLAKEGKKIKESNAVEKCIGDIFRYMKNYQNTLIRGGQIFENYRFSDEREWRYVIDSNEAIPFLITEPLYKTQDQKDIVNKFLENYRLEFTPNDIKYVIIQSESEIPEFLDILRTSKGNKYTYSDVERLMTRLITTEQIREDF